MLTAGTQIIDNDAFFAIDRQNGYPPQAILSDTIEPDILAARFRLHPETRAIEKYQFYTRGSWDENVDVYLFKHRLKLTFIEQSIDTFLDSVSFYGTASFDHENKTLSIPFYYKQFLDEPERDHSLTLNPFKDTMEVSTLVDLLFGEERTAQLPMPKGISTIYGLPVSTCSIYLHYKTKKPNRVSVTFKTPPYFFMPKIMFQGVTGDLQLDFLSQTRQEVNVFLNGYTIINGVKFMASVQKMQS